MKKILILFSLALTCALSFGQNPVTKAPGTPGYTFSGNGTTLNEYLGYFKSKKGLINGIYTDTTEANLGYADAYAGAQIFTTSDNLLWIRNNSATRWVSVASGSSRLDSLNFASDTTLIVCYQDGSCDTISIGNFVTIINNIVNNFNDSTVYNFNDSTLIICNASGSCDTIHLGNSNNYFFLNDSTLVTCDTLETICIGDSCYQQQICDTIPVPKLGAALQFQEGLYKIPNTPIVELGNPFAGEGGNNLYRNTWLYANPGYLTVQGKLLAHEPLVVTQDMMVEESPSIQSWKHIGRGYSSGIDNSNDIYLYFNYTDPFYRDSTGFVFDRIGYIMNTNGRGGRYGMGYDNVSSKQTGFLLHTLDTANKDAMTIFGKQAPTSMAFPVNPHPTSTWYENRIAVFKTTGQFQLPQYTGSTFRVIDTTNYKPLVKDASGNIFSSYWFGSGGGGGTGTISRIGAIDSLSKSSNGMQISGISIIPQTADSSYPGLLSIKQYKRLFRLDSLTNPTGTITFNEDNSGQLKIKFTSTGGRTIAFSNLNAGDIALINFDNTSGSAITLTLPSNSYINYNSTSTATIPTGKSGLSLNHFDGTNYWFIQNFEAITGSAGQVGFFNSPNTLSGDNGLFWDNTNKILGIGTVSPSTKAVIELSSSNKGFIIPRLTSAQRTGITSPGAGQLVFDTDSLRYFGNDGTNWKSLAWRADAGGGGGGGTPGGSSSEVQYNNGGSFGGATGFTYQSGASPNVTIQAQNAAYVPFVAKGAASQSTNLQEWQNSSGTVLSYVTKEGYFNSPQGVTTAPSFNVAGTGVGIGYHSGGLGLYTQFGGFTAGLTNTALILKNTSSVIDWGNGSFFSNSLTMRIGNPTSGTLQLMASQTALNTAATTVKIAAAQSTGTAAPAGVFFQTGVPTTSGTTAQTLGDRLAISGNYTTLTEATATAFVRVNVPTGTISGGEVVVTVEANDGTDFQSRTLRLVWTAVNKGGTTTITISTPEEVAAVSTGTLTCTITAVDSGSGNVDFKADASSSLTQTVLRANCIVKKNMGTGVITPQ